MAVGTIATLYRRAGYCTVIPPTAACEFPTAQSSKKASFNDLTLDLPTKSLNKFIAACAENHAIQKKFLQFYNVVSTS